MSSPNRQERQKILQDLLEEEWRKNPAASTIIAIQSMAALCSIALQAKTPDLRYACTLSAMNAAVELFDKIANDAVKKAFEEDEAI